MSGGGKRLTTSQRVFSRWMRTENLIRDIDGLIKELVQVRRKVPNRDDQVGIRDGVDLLSIARTHVDNSRKKLAKVMDESEARITPKAKPRKKANV